MKKTTKPTAIQVPTAQVHRQGAAGRKLAWVVRLWSALLGLVGGQYAAAQATRHGQPEDVFIKIATSQANVYAGQALTVSYLLYHRVPLIESDNEVNLTFKNCLVQEFPPLEKVQEGNETIAGRVYQVALIKKYLLIPQLAGTLQIPALTQHYSFNAPPSPEDFFGEQRLVSKAIRSASLPLLVRPLPVPGDSVAFCNAVGQFRFQPTYTVSQKTDNLLTVRLQLTGTGTLKNFKLPPLLLPANVDIFNVRSETRDTLTTNDLQATGIFSYDVLAAYRGTYMLPSISLAYFDPAVGRYVSFVGPAFRWRVAQGSAQPSGAASSAAMPAGVSRGLYTKSSLTESQASYLFLRSKACYRLLLLAGFFFLAGLGWTYQLNARAANRKYLIYRKAKRLASQAIRKIERTPAVDNDVYYKSLTNVLITYLGHKLDLPPLAFSYHDLPLLLTTAAVPASLQDQIITYLSLLRRLRFSASRPAEQPNVFYSKELLTLIQQLDACLHYNLPLQLVGTAA